MPHLRFESDGWWIVWVVRRKGHDSIKISTFTAHLLFKTKKNFMYTSVKQEKNTYTPARNERSCVILADRTNIRFTAKKHENILLSSD
jgi:hypothetical protein